MSPLKNKSKNVKRDPKREPAFSPESRRTLKVIGVIVLIALSFYLLIAVFSYLVSWKADQAIALGSATELAETGEAVAENNGGTFGAKIGNLLVEKWFGALSLFLPISLFLFSLLILHPKSSQIRKLILTTLSGMVIWSVALAFLTPFWEGICGSSPGGGIGLVISDYLKGVIGGGGTLIAVLLFISFWIIYTFPKSINGYIALGRSIKKGFLNLITESEKDRERKARRAGIKAAKRLRKEAEREARRMTHYLSAGEPEAAAPAETADPLPEPENIEEAEIVTEEEPEEIPVNPFETTDEPQEEKAPETDFIFEIAKEEEAILPVAEPETASVPAEADDKFEIAITSNAEIAEGVTLGDDVRLTCNEAEEMEMADIDQSIFDPTLELSGYQLPPIDLLDDHAVKVTVTEQEIFENKQSILDTLSNFNISIEKIKATIGPTVTLYEIIPAPGVRISKIKNLEDDIALSLSALGIRIIAPMPGKGTIGIEVPNKNKEVVSMYSVVKSVKFQESDADLPIVLGRTIQNKDFVIDLTKMPHILVAGATGQGKSVGLNAIITSLLYKKHPAELKFVLVDPKKVELTLYANIENHYLAKLPGEEESIITDTQKVIFTLNSLCQEMDNRYDLLKTAKVRNIKEYNEKFKARRLNPNKGHRFLPYFVVIIDEFADLIMTAGKEIETPISRIAQLARAVGIHLVIATQRPTTNIITGVIKANFPARIAFRVTSMIDSRTILDQPGANQLIGRGDMLISTGNEITRVQCAFIDTPEVERITEFIGAQVSYGAPYELPEYVPPEKDHPGSGDEENGTLSKRDNLFDEIARYVVTNQQGSASTIQRNFSIGFNRAGRIMDQLERAGIVGKQHGSKPRQVLITDLASLEVLLYDLDNNRWGGNY